MAREGYVPLESDVDVAVAGDVDHHGDHLGDLLHRSVPFDSWCVTWEDLAELRGEVRLALREGRLRPTDLDPFDPKDERFGPSIYTVVEQLIKPRTKEAGNMSWALMKHPQGLLCDVFVTHAWEEGIFEFLDKVLDSWPPGARHAYCCMLSNPQNLDIASLIADPLSSPFAHALEQAEHMLVVPNRHNSIYTRIWCAFEAHLGVQLNKRITTAMSRPHGFWIRQLAMLAVLCCSMAAGAFAGHASAQRWGAQMEAHVLVAVLLAFVAFAGFTLLSFGQKRQRLLVISLTIFGGLYLGTLGDYVLLASDCMYDFLGYRTCLGLYIQIGLWIPTMSSCILLIEADRQWSIALHEQSFQLYQNFTGVADARSSQPADKRTIMSEISNHGGHELVDAAVSVLISSGVSTPELREVARHQIQVEHAGMYKMSVAAFAWSVWLHGFVYVSLCVEWGSLAWCFSVVAILEALLWAIVWCALSLEQRTFGVWTASMFTTPMAYMALWITYFEKVVLSGYWSSCMGVILLVLLIVHDVFLVPLVLYSTAVGPAGTLNLPYLGPLMVRSVLGKSDPTEAQLLLQQRLSDLLEVEPETPKPRKTDTGAPVDAVDASALRRLDLGAARKTANAAGARGRVGLQRLRTKQFSEASSPISSKEPPGTV